MTLPKTLLCIVGDAPGMPFEACATRNLVLEATACFVLVQGAPHGMIFGEYPDSTFNETRMRKMLLGGNSATPSNRERLSAAPRGSFRSEGLTALERRLIRRRSFRARP